VAAAGLAGCRSDGASPGVADAATTAGPPPATPGSDADIARHALNGEQALLGVYRRLARANPSARRRIAALIRVQGRHVDALVTALDLDGLPSAPTVTVARATPIATIVAGAATHAGDARRRDCRRVESGALASMMASMAAAHAVVAAQWSDAS
jgi:hypothetical protein